jgi:hypothetical protein
MIEDVLNSFCGESFIRRVYRKTVRWIKQRFELTEAHEEEMLMAVRALRTALGDKPCVEVETNEGTELYHFDDQDLMSAVKAILPYV